ncbi:MAG: DUF5127 domain-containing protein [Acidobacteriia bacterium]|nr:DUF5127 domain-containing protein [Terriglobia bacterium]
MPGPRDLEVFSRPFSYVVWSVNTTEGGQHDVAVYLNASAALAVNTSDQPVSWARFHLADGMSAVRSGSQQQPVPEKETSRSPGPLVQSPQLGPLPPAPPSSSSPSPKAA